MKAIRIFENSNFGKIRISTNDDDEPLFCLSDVCRVLDLQGAAVQRRLDKDVISNHPLETPGGIQLANFVNEDGLYDVILDSRKPEAKQFRKWITSEVLPSIRKHGAYMTNQIIEKALSSPDFLIQLATNLKEEKEKRVAAEAKVQIAEAKIQEDAPKVTFTNAIIGSKSSCLIGELAKLLAQNGIQIGEKRLFQWMRDNKYLCSTGERKNLPFQTYIEQGLFEIKRGVRSGNNGVLYTTSTTKVTGKGQYYFVNKFLSNRKK